MLPLKAHDNQTQVFVSYAREDVEEAKKIYEFLNSEESIKSSGDSLFN